MKKKGNKVCERCGASLVEFANHSGQGKRKYCRPCSHEAAKESLRRARARARAKRREKKAERASKRLAQPIVEAKFIEEIEEKKKCLYCKCEIASRRIEYKYCSRQCYISHFRKIYVHA